MDINEVFNQIKKRWALAERYRLIEELEEAPRGAATGGEVQHLYAKFFLELKENDLIAFSEIADLVDEFAKECAKNGTIIKGYNYKPYSS